MRFLAFIRLKASDVVSDGSSRRADVFGLGRDGVLRLRRAREGFGGVWEVCVGELLEDGVLGRSR